MSHLLVRYENNVWTGVNSFLSYIQFRGSSSGTVTLATLATAGTPTISLPSSSGTVAVSATSPITVNGTTGNITLGTVGVANGGTGITSYAVGDLLYASGSTTLSKLADVAVGSYLRSGGVTTAPLWSTLILPNAATSGRVVFASATNTYGEDADLTFTGGDTLNFTKGVTTTITHTAGSGGTTDGMSWNDTTQKAHAVYEAGVKQMLVGTLFTQTNTVTVANTAAETAITGTGVGTLTLPANFFVAGKTIRFYARGFHSSTANPNVTVKFKLGSTTIMTTATVSGGNGSNDGFVAFGDITCRTTGGSGTVIGQGQYLELHSSAAILGMVSTGTTTIDTTASQAVSVTFTWGTASASNTISCTNFTLEALN